MTSLLRFINWLFGIKPKPPTVICHWCWRRTHTHDLTTNRCIATWCECGQDLTAGGKP